MYFRQKNYFLLNRKEKVDVLTFNKIDQLMIFYKLFDDFIKYHHKKIIEQNKLSPFKEKTKEYYNLKLSLRFENKFRHFLNIYDEIIKKNYSEKFYFNNINSQFKRSNWYSFKKLIMTLSNKYLNDSYFEFWLKIRNNKNNQKLNKIAIKTIKKILSEELGLSFKTSKKYIRKHPKRQYFAKPGLIQMDLKIIGIKDTSMNKKLTIFNMIETRSRFSFSKVLESGSTENVLSALKEGKEEFANQGIEIKAIQTDNAMMFKGTNFINSDGYCAYLKEQNILRRLIPLGVPQCNGCIERFHLTIDKKCSSLLSKVKTIDEAQEIIKEFSKEYNFNRYHYYSELETRNIKYDKRYMIPSKAIKLLYNYQ